MAPFAQAHERTEPEFIDVPTMRLDVITDFCRRDDAALQTELAERMREQLLLPDPPSDRSCTKRPTSSVGRDQP
jgi:hypothetical protein